jgi:hypothetical protein
MWGFSHHDHCELVVVITGVITKPLRASQNHRQRITRHGDAGKSLLTSLLLCLADDSFVVRLTLWDCKRSGSEIPIRLQACGS